MLKKIVTILTAWFCLLGVWAINNKPIFSDFSSRYEVYSMANGSNAIIEQTSKSQYFIFSLKYGESCCVDKLTFNQQEFLEHFNAQITFTESTSYGTSIYAYSPQIKYSTLIKGKKTNLHVFINSQMVKVGSPIIFGSY